jgi:hypothetical protein
MKFLSKNKRNVLFKVVFIENITPYYTEFKKGTIADVLEVRKTKKGSEVYFTNGYGKILAKYCKIVN